MKQKEIFIHPSLGLETEKMVEMYFAVKTVNGIEGFIYSEGEFLREFKNKYSYYDLRTSKYYSVYRDRCEICDREYEILIRNRSQLYKYLKKSTNYCNGCRIINSAIESLVGNKID